MSEFSIHVLKPTEDKYIDLIADWYFSEFSIPQTQTRERLSDADSQRVISHLLLKDNHVAMATGGLYNIVGLVDKYSRFNKLKPWVSLLYTHPEYRNLGIGTRLLTSLEQQAKSRRYEKLYLHSFTAEDFYLARGWTVMETETYKNHHTSVMQKDLR